MSAVFRSVFIALGVAVEFLFFAAFILGVLVILGVL